MEITEAGRKKVQSKEFSKELKHVIQTARDCGGTPGNHGLWFIVMTLCSLPPESQPTQEDMEAFWPKYGQEVIAAVCAATLDISDLAGQPVN